MFYFKIYSTITFVWQAHLIEHSQLCEELSTEYGVNNVDWSRLKNNRFLLSLQVHATFIQNEYFFSVFHLVLYLSVLCERTFLCDHVL